MQYRAEYDLNQAAYERLREEIDRRYPKGRFVGLFGGKIVADADSYEVIDRKLNELGFEPLRTMVVQVGRDAVGEILAPFSVLRK